MPDPHAPIDWPTELQRYRRWMTEVARARLEDAHAVDDVIQDVSLTVMRQDSKPTHPGKVRAWLYRIVVRRVADHLRRKYGQKQLIERYAHEMASQARGATDGSGEAGEGGGASRVGALVESTGRSAGDAAGASPGSSPSSSSGSSPGPGWVMAWDRSASPDERLAVAMDRLPGDEREMLTLKYRDGWSYRQLAERFGVSERVVEYRLVRAKQMLRTEMLAQLDREET